MNTRVVLGLFLITLCALALRAPELDRRPMHNDEAVNAIKLQGLWEKGIYHYDPDEYHGPLLYYATLPALWLSGAKGFPQVTETTLRLVPVVFGAGLILLLWLLADGLGRAGTLFAGILTAISPAMVFYSRYFIHEMLLVFFTLLLIAAGWRYVRKPHAGWAVLGGAALGLSYTTKETFVISLAALAGAGLLTMIWGAWRGTPGPSARPPDLANPGQSPGSVGTPLSHRGTVPSSLVGFWNWKHALLAVLAAALVSVVFFSSFFTNPAGPLDALRTYLPWLRRAGGASLHNNPWSFYLERLLFFHQGRGPIWTEAVILILASIGFLAVLRRRSPASGSQALLRFLGFYTALLLAAYSLISYKTPWCLLGFWNGMILLAGTGAAVILRWQTRRWLQALLSATLVFAAAHLIWEAWQTSFVHPADRKNPYAYAQTSPDVLELVEKVRALASVHPAGDAMVIKVMVPDRDYWPLPWYLRQFAHTGWWDSLPADPRAPVMIVGARLQAGLDDKLEESHTMTGIYSLRSRVFLDLFVEQDLWKRFMADKDKLEHH
jgi:uncharacterized protein (TIGR03663 family)